MTAERKFWAIAYGRRASDRTQVGPFETREQALEAAKPLHTTLRRGKDILSGYGAEGPLLDIRWHRVERVRVTL